MDGTCAPAHDIQAMLRAARARGSPLRIAAPMVRYSRQPFRQLVRKYGAEVAFSPMIVAETFVRRQEARDMDLHTSPADRPLVVQFAARRAEELVLAAQLVAGHADAVDLNCGCPQKWAMHEGFGSHLINHPELVADMVRQTRQRVPALPVSIKIRLCDRIQDTVELARRAEAAGAAWISIHGRTPAERGQPVRYDEVKVVVESVGIPAIHNGDVNSLAEGQRVFEATGVCGVMSARGLLANPALFAGYERTTPEVVADYLRLALELGTPSRVLQNQVLFMLEHEQSKLDRSYLASISSVGGTLDYLEEALGISVAWPSPP